MYYFLVALVYNMTMQAALIVWIKAHKLVAFFIGMGILFVTLLIANQLTHHESKTNTSSKVVATSISKSGTYVCLPNQKKNMAAKTCSATLKADDGHYYLLVESNTKAPVMSTTSFDTRVQLTGWLLKTANNNAATSGTVTVTTFGPLQ